MFQDVLKTINPQIQKSSPNQKHDKYNVMNAVTEIHKCKHMIKYTIFPDQFMH